uniref:Lon N-terminal domain-containing protein n=1 Tax=Parastrongyloides trichosuri TaxID=131310 RepID=A0A0N5A380_PARTI
MSISPNYIIPRVDPEFFNNTEYYFIAGHRILNTEKTEDGGVTMELILELDNYPGFVYASPEELSPTDVNTYLITQIYSSMFKINRKKKIKFYRNYMFPYNASFNETNIISEEGNVNNEPTKTDEETDLTSLPETLMATLTQICYDRDYEKMNHIMLFVNLEDIIEHFN